MGGVRSSGPSLARRIARWLQTLENVRDVRPVRLTFPNPKKADVGYGARYTDVRAYTADMAAVTRGRKQAGDPYTHDCFYLAGPRPPSSEVRIRVGSERFAKHSYRFPAADDDWYVASWFDPNTLDRADPRYAEILSYHPFGAHWLLLRWDHRECGERIDRYYEALHEPLPVRARYLTKE